MLHAIKHEGMISFPILMNECMDNIDSPSRSLRAH